MIEEHDQRERRCPMLGHEVRFQYCRQYQKSIPCRRIHNCWFECFDITAFINDHYTEEEIKIITAPPKDKRVSLFELMKKAQETNAEVGARKSEQEKRKK